VLWVEKGARICRRWLTMGAMLLRDSGQTTLMANVRAPRRGVRRWWAETALIMVPVGVWARYEAARLRPHLTLGIRFARLGILPVWADQALTNACRSGGIGRRAWFRSTYSQGCGGSSPFFGTKSIDQFPAFRTLASPKISSLLNLPRRTDRYHSALLF
jgi:hypothetical protein